MPPKIGLLGFHMHKFFEPIPFFDTQWTIVHGLKGKLGHFWKQPKRSKIFETREATPTKIGVHALNIRPYLHEFFESILID